MDSLHWDVTMVHLSGPSSQDPYFYNVKLSSCDWTTYFLLPVLLDDDAISKMISSVSRNNKRTFLKLGFFLSLHIEQVVQGEAIKAKYLCYIHVNIITNVKLLFAKL